MKDLCIHLPASLMRKSCSKLAEIPGYFCWQKWGVNLPADLVTVGKSASRNGGYFCQQISWLTDLVPVTKSAGRFTPLHFCQQIYPPPFLLADLLTVTKYASRSPHFCQQIYWLADLLTVTESASRFTPPIFASRFPDWQLAGRNTRVFLPADWQICWHSRKTFNPQG